MYEHTVVGWDGSPPASAAVEWAARRVSGRSDSLLIVRAVDGSAAATDEATTRWAMALAGFELAELAARLRVNRPALHVTTDAVRGEPSTVLSRLAGPETLVVVGTDNDGTDQDWYSSRVGARLAALVAGAVAIIPVRDARPRSGVLAGVDGSVESASLCLFAAELAASRGEVLDAVFVSPGGPAGASADGPAGRPGRILDRALALTWREHPALPVNRHLEAGRPDAVLLRYARDAALVVVGTRRPGVLRRLRLGSVSQALVNHAGCPTIVVCETVPDPDSRRGRAHR